MIHYRGGAGWLLGHAYRDLQSSIDYLQHDRAFHIYDNRDILIVKLAHMGIEDYDILLYEVGWFEQRPMPYTTNIIVCCNHDDAQLIELAFDVIDNLK
jgi:hypothetical protein